MNQVKSGIKLNQTLFAVSAARLKNFFREDQNQTQLLLSCETPVAAAVAWSL